jgi:hypothetical protein
MFRQFARTFTTASRVLRAEGTSLFIKPICFRNL